MTSTAIGLPDRYRPIDQVGPDEPTATGVIRCWRAKDRVLNRDVAIRVHTPAGEAAHDWIARALTAGGLATPALAMVYDASEGTAGDSGGDPTPGSAAYVVNEWIDGETLADRLTRGPLPDREVRTILRRLAEGVAEAHRVGLAVGGLTPENVVLRPNGLVGLRAVPAATGTMDGDIAALGALLEVSLTGLGADGEPGPLTGAPDLVALVRRARSTEPGSGLSSVAAMAALLAERPRGGTAGSPPPFRGDDTDSGWLRRLRERRHEPADAPVRLDPQTLPPVPPVRPLAPGETAASAGIGGDTIEAGSVAPRAGAYAAPGLPPPPGRGDDDRPFGVLPAEAADDDDYYYDPADDEDGASRHKLVVVGLPLLALALVIGLAWWIGSALLSVAPAVDETGSLPSTSAPAESPAAPESPVAGAPVPVTAVSVFDPFGDGEPENDGSAPLVVDGDPATTWSTLTYRGSPAFGNLKPGVGLLLDLGSEQEVAGVTVVSTTPGATVEIRTGGTDEENLDAFTPAADGTLENESEFAFEEAVPTRYVLVWLTGLVDAADGFSAELAEVTVSAAN